MRAFSFIRQASGIFRGTERAVIASQWCYQYPHKETVERARDGACEASGRHGMRNSDI